MRSTVNSRGPVDAHARRVRAEGEIVADLHRGMREIAVLQEVTRMSLAATNDLDAVLHQVLLVVRNFFGVTNCAIFLVDHSAGYVYCRVQDGYGQKYQGMRFRMSEESAIGAVACTHMPMHVPDVAREPRYSPADPAIRSALLLPLMVRDELLGVLEVGSDQPTYFGEDSISLLALFAAQAAVAVDNALLYTAERRRMRQIELMDLVARSATTATQVEQFLNTLAELICDSFDGTSVAVFVRGADDRLHLRARTGTLEPVPEISGTTPVQGTLGEALARRALVMADSLNAEHPGCFSNRGSELTVPLLCCGEMLGAVVLGHPEEHYFDAEDQAIAQAAADVAATAMKNVLLADELRRVSTTDFLTGLYNQRYFHLVVAQEAARAKRYNKPFALAMLDIRRFRNVNAAIGFDGGDELLRQLGRALLAHMRKNDTLCRYAADRFAFVFPETDSAPMGAIMAKLRASLDEIHYRVDEQPRRLAAAFATAQYPQQGTTDVELIRALMDRMQRAKQQTATAGE